jgi:hypothetical protein
MTMLQSPSANDDTTDAAGSAIVADDAGSGVLYWPSTNLIGEAVSVVLQAASAEAVVMSAAAAPKPSTADQGTQEEVGSAEEGEEEGGTAAVVLYDVLNRGTSARRPGLAGVLKELKDG